MNHGCKRELRTEAGTKWAHSGMRRKVPALCGALGPARVWPMEQVQRKVWGNQGGGEETKIALFRLGKGGKG